MANNHPIGDAGELEVVKLVPCPNCGKSLMVLPPNYPLYDVQCTGCSFRAQIKTNRTNPKDSILGAGWGIFNKVLKAGYISPPLVVNFKWCGNNEEQQEIRFYPFIPKNTLVPYQLSAKAKRANYKMFRYTGLDWLPYFLLYKSEGSKWQMTALHKKVSLKEAIRLVGKIPPKKIIRHHFVPKKADEN